MRNIKLLFEWARTELAAEGTEVRAHTTLPKLGKPLVEILERDEIQRIEDVADSERDKLIVRVLADTGLRVGELVKLRLRDLIESNNLHHLRVAGRSQGGGAKGDKGRLVGLQPQLARRLRRYIDRQRPQDADTDRIFVSRRRDWRTGTYEPLTESGVQQLVVRELGHRGIAKRSTRTCSGTARRRTC